MRALEYNSATIGKNPKVKHFFDEAEDKGALRHLLMGMQMLQP